MVVRPGGGFRMKKISCVIAVAAAAAFQCPPPRIAAARIKRRSSSEEEEEEKVVAKKEEEPWVYFFGRPGELDADLRLLGTSRGRILQFVSLGTAVALAGDLLGITSRLLSTQPEAARSLRLDTYYSVDGLRRYLDDDKFEFLYPQTWLQDRNVFLARQDDDFLRKRSPLLTAFKSGRENVSVAKSGLMSGFSLRKTLGEPTVAAQRLLDTAIAPPESGKTATLLAAKETERGYYEIEYTVQLPNTQIIHNLAVVADRRNDLYTLTILCPEAAWTDREPLFRDVAASFLLS